MIKNRAILTRSKISIEDLRIKLSVEFGDHEVSHLLALTRIIYEMHDFLYINSENILFDVPLNTNEEESQTLNTIAGIESYLTVLYLTRSFSEHLDSQIRLNSDLNSVKKISNAIDGYLLAFEAEDMMEKKIRNLLDAYVVSMMFSLTSVNNCRNDMGTDKNGT